MICIGWPTFYSDLNMMTMCRLQNHSIFLEIFDAKSHANGETIVMLITL